MHSTDPWVSQPQQELVINKQGVHCWTGEIQQGWKEFEEYSPLIQLHRRPLLSGRGWQCTKLADVVSFGGHGASLQLTVRANSLDSKLRTSGLTSTYHWHSKQAAAVLHELRVAMAGLPAGQQPTDLGDSVQAQLEVDSSGGEVGSGRVGA